MAKLWTRASDMAGAPLVIGGMLYGRGLPQKLIGGCTDKVGLGIYEENKVSLCCGH
jgi:hypothetical protein